MIIIIAIQTAGLLLLLSAIWSFTRVPGWRRTPAHRAFALGTLSALLIIGSLAVSCAILLQEKKGFSVGMSGGIASDARQWLAQHKSVKPAKTEIGENIKVLSDGLSFLRSRQSSLSSAVRTRIDDLSRIPEKPTRLLTSTEQSRYYEGAVEVYSIIEQLGTPPDGGEGK